MAFVASFCNGVIMRIVIFVVNLMMSYLTYFLITG
nr:MAG TPA: Toxin Ibs, type I toxin-antitoxin system [Caudoviricetes sp.]